MVTNWMLQPHHAGLLWAWWSFFIACVWFLAIYQPWCQLLVLKRAELAASNPSQINTQLYRGHLSLQLDNWTLLEFPAKSPKKILKMYVGRFQNKVILWLTMRFQTSLLKLIGTHLEVNSQGCSAICILLTNFLSPLRNRYLEQGNWTHKLFLQ